MLGRLSASPDPTDQRRELLAHLLWKPLCGTARQNGEGLHAHSPNPSCGNVSLHPFLLAKIRLHGKLLSCYLGCVHF